MKKHILPFLTLLIICFSTLPVKSQDYIVDFTYLGSRTKAQLFAIFFQAVEYDVDLYKIRYKTLDIHGQLDTASGLMVLPQVPPDTELPMVVYGHGTTTGPDDVPSNLSGGYQIAMAYAASGFATVAPDYLGLGDARGFHPYLHAASEASASLDMLFAGYEYLEREDPELDPNYLFLAGYSQGGHASMALHKEIDDNWSIIIPVTAATHMSGPYSISEVMRDRVVSDENYGNPSYIAYLFLSYNEVYELYGSVADVFKPEYVDDIEQFYSGEINLTELNTELLNTLAAGGNTYPKRMLQDSIVDGLINDPNHPFNQALALNDTYIWGPPSPTRLYYCGADTQVPALNSVIADSAMNASGAYDTESIDLNPNFDHGACVFLAVRNSVDYFLSFLTPISVNPEPKYQSLKVFPNPANAEIIIEWEAAKSGVEFQIYNSKGDNVKSGTTTTNKIFVNDLPSGIYMIICSAGGESRMARIMRQ